MRIIKGGRKPPKEIEMECDRCGCVFAYEKEDVQYDQYEDDRYVLCPNCHKAFDVEPFPDY